MQHAHLADASAGARSHQRERLDKYREHDGRNDDEHPVERRVCVSGMLNDEDRAANDRGLEIS